jgi:N utilization substance protein B
MKTPTDPRHIRRRNIVKSLFAESFTHQNNLQDEVNKIIKKQKKINKIIVSAAPTWPIEKINKIDLAILHLSVYELLEKAAPPKVVIDEAVELSKEFGSESSASFVNGVLGTIYDNLINLDEKNIRNKKKVQ